ncbi:hypothetical protein HDC88_000299 [Pseudomonas sp. SJZ073]|nr:hypothetical protein [Pseudomonas sp. SJZ073]
MFSCNAFILRNTGVLRKINALRYRLNNGTGRRKHSYTLSGDADETVEISQIARECCRNRF